MPIAPLTVLDDRGHRRVFAMLSLLAAGEPMPRAQLLDRACRLVPLSEQEQARAPESNASEGSQERRTVDRTLTRAYETLRDRGLLERSPATPAWTLTEAGRHAVQAAEGSYRDFWDLGGDGQADPPVTGSPSTQAPQREPRGALNQILYGPPGTGKTYSTAAVALAALGDPASDAPDSSVRRQALRRYEDAGQVVTVTFHQAYSYEDFVEGIRPVLTPAGSGGADGADDGRLRYRVEPGVLRRLARSAEQEPDKRFVLIIDEINRGNVAGVFGELITLLEPDKRIGAAQATTVELPYSRERFGLPSNLHVVGTMNTADRSLAGLDVALRRRFDFLELPPRPELLTQVIEGLAVADVLRGLNERIQVAKGREFAVGHATFIRTLDESGSTTAALRRIFEHGVLPLLQEYFFEDDQQIADVLGQPRTAAPHNYLLRRPTGQGRDFWTTDPSALDRIAFYRQVAGAPAAAETEPAPTGQVPEAAPALTPGEPGGDGTRVAEGPERGATDERATGTQR